MHSHLQASRTEQKRYKDLEDNRGLVTATLALRFLAARYFINKRAKVLCSVEVKGHEFNKEEELKLNPSAAFDLYASGGKLLLHAYLIYKPLRLYICY